MLIMLFVEYFLLGYIRFLNIIYSNKDNVLLDYSNNEFGEYYWFFACEKYHELYLSKQSYRNLALIGHGHVMEVLYGH